MPEHAQLAVVELPCFICLDCFVDTEILVVTGKDFHRVAAGVVVKNEVLQQIKEVLFFADAAQHRFQSYAALLFFVKTLPFMEEFVLAAQRTDLGLGAVRQYKEGVVIEQMRYRILIIGIVVIVGVLNVYGVFL